MTHPCHYCNQPLTPHRRSGCEWDGPVQIAYHADCRAEAMAAALAEQRARIAERRAREMNAEMPCETRAMMHLKGVV